MENLINTIAFTKNTLPKIEVMEAKLESYQGYVDGLIDFVSLYELSEKGMELIVNDEGLLLDLPITAIIIHKCGQLPVYGDFLIVGMNPLIGEVTDLTDEQTAFISKAVKGGTFIDDNIATVIDLTN